MASQINIMCQNGIDHICKCAKMTCNISGDKKWNLSNIG